MRSIDREYILARAKDGQTRVACPACGPDRKTKNDPTLSIKQDSTGILWTCHHCGVTGSMGRGGKVSAVSAVVPIKTYSAEEVDFGGLDYLASRGISEGTAKLLGICSGMRFFKKTGKELEALGFVYRHQGRATAIKWRSLSTKEFTQDGSAQTLFLADRLQPGQDVIITEGELDSVSFYEAGIPAVSIPSGALAEGTADDAARLKWLSHHDELIQKAENVYLAVDMDGPGQTTANELARRIGKLKCWRISFPPGCKDANDTLVQHGAEALAQCKAKATRWPVEGLAAPSDFLEKVQSLYRDGLPRGASTGWPGVDELFTLNPGSLVIVTGSPGSGKSQMIDNMLVNAMKQHNWRVAYASFENPPELHLAKLISLHTAKPFGDGPTPRITEDEMLEAMGWVNERLTFLTNEGVMPTVESLVERFEAAVRRSGVKACVVDPFNFIRLNTKKDGGIDTESINEMLAAFKTFAMRAEITFFLIAHPAKPMNSGPDWVPTGYSIAGCHDERTEVLTDKGWIPHPLISKDHVVACFDLSTGGLAWHNPSVVHEYPYAGPMHHYTGYSLDALVTPNHRMVVKNYWATNGNPVNKSAMDGLPWRFIYSEDMPSAQHLMPLATLPQTEGVEVPAIKIGGVSYDMDNFLRAVGWFVSEGWTQMKAPAWCQAVGPLQERMSETLRGMGFPISECLEPPQGKGTRVMWKARVRRTEARDLADWFSDKCGVGSENKKLPGFVFGLNVRQMRVLLDALIDGDGSITKRGLRYHTTSILLAGQVQEIAIRCGMAASIASHGRAEEHRKDRYTVNINGESRKVRTLSIKNNRKIVHYDGFVFCLTVPTGAYITRRNGMMAITGNSAHFFNRADFGLTVQRKMDSTIFHVWKCRFPWQGGLGDTALSYDKATGLFHEGQNDGPTDTSFLEGFDERFPY